MLTSQTYDPYQYVAEYTDDEYNGEDGYNGAADDTFTAYHESPETIERGWAQPASIRLPNFDGMLLVTAVLVLFMGLNIWRDRVQVGVVLAAAPAGGQPAPLDSGNETAGMAAAPAAVSSFVFDPNGEANGDPGLQFSAEEMTAVAAPYAEYTLTQGVHGTAYGHAAIDLAAGKGVAVLSPINGLISEKYVDQYGNTTLIIENDFYRVTLLHGKYSVEAGEGVTLGQAVGVESNKGYTTDMQGNLCAGRNCGYHTHLNIFDKVSGENVNPLTLIR